MSDDDVLICPRCRGDGEVRDTEAEREIKNSSEAMRSFVSLAAFPLGFLMGGGKTEPEPIMKRCGRCSGKGFIRRPKAEEL